MLTGSEVAGVEPEDAGGVVAGDDVLVTVVVPSRRPRRGSGRTSQRRAGWGAGVPVGGAGIDVDGAGGVVAGDDVVATVVVPVGDAEDGETVPSAGADEFRCLEVGVGGLFLVVPEPAVGVGGVDVGLVLTGDRGCASGSRWRHYETKVWGVSPERDVTSACRSTTNR
jgi:hypothetical protein